MPTLTTPHKLTTRILSRTAVGVAALTVGALASVPSAFAATDGGGAPAVTQAATTARPASSPFTIGLSSTSVAPGSEVTISGLASARAGTPLTIMSDAIGSSRVQDGLAAVRTPAFVEGTYRATVIIPAAITPGTYPIELSVGGRTVATSSITVAAHGTSTRAAGPACGAIGFTVLHNDRAGGVALAAGRYRLASRDLDCGTASADLTAFLDRDAAAIPGWSATATVAGGATFTQHATGDSFTVTPLR